MLSNLNSVIFEGRLIKRGDRYYVKSTRHIKDAKSVVTTIGLALRQEKWLEVIARAYAADSNAEVRIVGCLVPGILLKPEHIEVKMKL